jgi:hypothetical protein
MTLSADHHASSHLGKLRRPTAGLNAKLGQGTTDTSLKFVLPPSSLPS